MISDFLEPQIVEKSVALVGLLLQIINVIALLEGRFREGLTSRWSDVQWPSGRVT